VFAPDDRISRLESAIHDLEHSVRVLEHRVALVEQSGSAAISPGRSDVATSASPATLVRRDDLVTILTFVGRTCVALGGAYLLRALTDSGALPLALGVASGLAYALSFLVLADRARAQRTSAAFHGLVAALIAYPLLWEAALRFNLLDADRAAAAVSLVTLSAYGVAARRRVQAVAWIATAAALPTIVGLVAATGAIVPFAAVLIVLGIATLWLGYGCGWPWLRWPVAGVADLVVFGLTMRATSASSGEQPLATVVIQMLLLNGYLASIVVRTLVRARDVIVFEIVQTLLAVTIGFGGAVYVAQHTGSGVALLALMNLGFGAACYGVAFAFVARRQGVRRNFYYYTSLAVILILVSLLLLLDRAALAVACGTAAIVSTWAATRINRVTLNLHAAAYLGAAAVATGLLASAGDALAASATRTWTPFSVGALITLSGAVVCWLMPVSAVAGRSAALERAPRLLIVALLAWSVGGCVVSVAASTLNGVAGLTVSPGVVATIRTAALASTAMLLAWMGQRDRFRESAWLLYPLLVLGGLKLLAEDLQQSKPATLFVALAAYGAALIIGPRLVNAKSSGLGAERVDVAP
jgi:hypothetical protein